MLRGKFTTSESSSYLFGMVFNNNKNQNCLLSNSEIRQSIATLKTFCVGLGVFYSIFEVTYSTENVLKISISPLIILIFQYVYLAAAKVVTQPAV